MKNKFLTKLLCFVITIMMIIPSGITFVAAEETEEDPFVALADYGVYTFANADGDEISNLAVESGGGSDEEEEEGGSTEEPLDPETADLSAFNSVAVYINSADNAEGNGEGLNLVSTNNNAFNSADAYNTDLLDLSVPANMALVQANANASANYAKHSEVGYANIGGQSAGYDGAWMIKNNAFFTSWYITGRATTNWCAYTNGKLYFTVKDKITQADNNITFIVEYLDNGTEPFTLNYTNTSFVDNSDNASVSGVAIKRTGSGEWKRAIIQVNDANVAVGLKKTALADKAAQIKISSNGDTYISQVYVMKTSDYQAYLDGTLVLTDETLVENAKAQLKLNVTETKENFTLPASDVEGVTVTWKSDNDAIKVSGNNAVVTQGASDSIVKLTATISKGTASDKKVFEVKVPAKFGKAAGVEIVIGETPDADEKIGGIAFDAWNELIKRDTAEPTTGLLWESPGTADFDTARVFAGPENDKRWSVFTTRYYQEKRADRNCVRDGNIPFDVTEFKETDNELTFEIDYLDVGKNGISILYITDAAKGAVRTSLTKTNSGEWKTWTVTLNDVKFSEANTASGLGKSNKSDFRIEGTDTYISRVEVYTSKAYKDFIGAKQALNIDNVYDENGVEVANGTISSNFELPSTVEGFEGSEVTWESSNTDAIVFEGNVAKVQLSETGKQTVTITATIVMDGGFVQKSFDVTLAKKPRNLYFVSDAVVTGEKTDKANVAFDITNAADIIGKEVSLVVASIDEETDQILKINVVRKDVKYATLDIEATVDNAKGKLAYYLTMDNGAVIYNIAPDSIQNFKVCSTEKGINIKWDTPADDNMFIKEYVIYDGNDNVVDTISGDENSYFVPLAKKETRSYCMEGFDHAGLSTGKTEVKMGSLFKASGITVKLYDLNGKGSNKAMFNDYLTNPNTDNHSHEKEMTDEVTKEKIICRHTLKRVSTTDGYCSCGATLRAENNNKPTCLYFKPDGDYITKDTKEVAVIVKYYDYGKGKMNVEYNTYENMVKDLHCGGETKIELTGTNTFKTAVLKIYNAGFFSPSALSNADIRFSGGPDNEVYIAELKMMPLDNYMDQDDHIIYTVGK